MANPVVDFLRNRFFDRLAASPRGRAFIFDFLIDAEEGDEAGVFDQMVAKVQDPELNRMIRRHRDDEVEHAKIFRACRAAQGVPADAAAGPPKIIRYVAAEAGPLFDPAPDDRRTIMESFLLLRVIEERGVEQYPLIARAMEPHDPAGAKRIVDVARDEIRHVKYCKAISKRYAPDETTLARSLIHFRAVEKRAFDTHGRALMIHAIDADLLTVGLAERLFWRALAAMERRRLIEPRDLPVFSPTMKEWSAGSA